MIPPSLGPYRIDALIGEGATGVVYRAFDTRLHRTVAIKKLHTADAAGNARILREARAASGLNHSHICTVYDVGEADGQPFIAMEHVDGRVPGRARPGR